MTCSHCVESVEKSLLKLKGVKEVKIDLGSGEVQVFGEDFNKENIEKNIVSLGYKFKKENI